MYSNVSCSGYVNYRWTTASYKYITIDFRIYIHFATTRNIQACLYTSFQKTKHKPKDCRPNKRKRTFAIFIPNAMCAAQPSLGKSCDLLPANCFNTRILLHQHYKNNQNNFTMVHCQLIALMLHWYIVLYTFPLFFFLLNIILIIFNTSATYD